jgi:cation diffusion facilitator CzcD-associated flavoprotein CzcO
LITAGIRPTIFEAAKTIGGAWNPSSAISQQMKDDQITDHTPCKMWNGMHTNLSKYTCRFTDWPWPDDASTFPSVEEMHRYLQSYSDNFLDSDNCNFQFECKVTNIEQLDVTPKDFALQDGRFCYNVEWMDLKTNTRINRDFGGVVVATGFFNTPKFPSFMHNYLESNENAQTNTKPEVIHSSKYVTHKSFHNKNVAVIGSSFSALEIASDLSKSASRIVNVVSSVPWVLPRWVSKLEHKQTEPAANTESLTEDSTITILPVDLAFYQRTEPFPQKEVVKLDEENCQKRHLFLRSLAGSKQKYSPLGEPLNWSLPPCVAISDEYLDLTREGRISVVKGRLEGLNEDGSLSINDSQTIEDIDAVICCTGYSPHLHRFLSPAILKKLEYDPEDTFSPLSLAWDVFHPSLPGLAFCGMVS